MKYLNKLSKLKTNSSRRGDLAERSEERSDKVDRPDFGDFIA